MIGNGNEAAHHGDVIAGSAFCPFSVMMRTHSFISMDCLLLNRNYLVSLILYS
jgi:hypothetical protein